jgi:hypothetical protein
MVENGLPPCRCVMTKRALPGEVVGRLVFTVARLAVRGSGCLVVKTGRSPGIRPVACGALPVEMVGRLIHCMTGAAVDCTRQRVIEVDVLPID